MFSSYRSVNSAFTGRECIGEESLPAVRGGQGRSPSPPCGEARRGRRIRVDDGYPEGSRGSISTRGARLKADNASMKRGARGNPGRLSIYARDNLVAVAPIAVFGDALLDPATGDVVREAVVLIENDHVTASGARSKVQVPSDAKRVDAEGLWLLPGLIDCHVHLCMTGTTYDLGERLSRPASLTILQSVDGCAKDLAAGFTSVRDAGGTPNGVRMAGVRGYFPGPRMQLAITILTVTGIHADSMFPGDVRVPPVHSPDTSGSDVAALLALRLRVRETS